MGCELLNILGPTGISGGPGITGIPVFIEKDSKIVINLVDKHKYYLYNGYIFDNNYKFIGIITDNYISLAKFRNNRIDEILK